MTRPRASPTASATSSSYPATNPFNLTGHNIDILSYRFVPAGPRIESVASDNFRVVLRSTSSSATAGRSTSGSTTAYNFVDDVGANFPSDIAFQNALNGTNPPPPSIPSRRRRATRPPRWRRSLRPEESRETSSLIGEDFRLNGKLFDLPAGPVQIAFGGEYRIERLTQDFSDNITSGDVISEATELDTAASQKSLSGYTELDIPLTSPSFNIPGFYSVDVEAAARVDKYSQFGSTENPQVHLRWEVIPGLVLRGGYSRSFRAPSLTELAAGGNQAFGFVNDPNGGGPGVPENVEVTINTPGNANLKPETAETLTPASPTAPRRSRVCC